MNHFFSFKRLIIEIWSYNFLTFKRLLCFVMHHFFSFKQKDGHWTEHTEQYISIWFWKWSMYEVLDWQFSFAKGTFNIAVRIAELHNHHPTELTAVSRLFFRPKPVKSWKQPSFDCIKSACWAVILFFMLKECFQSKGTKSN